MLLVQSMHGILSVQNGSGTTVQPHKEFTRTRGEER